MVLFLKKIDILSMEPQSKKKIFFKILKLKLIVKRIKIHNRNFPKNNFCNGGEFQDGVFFVFWKKKSMRNCGKTSFLVFGHPNIHLFYDFSVQNLINQAEYSVRYVLHCALHC
jgi:hypothetical protein